MPTSQSVKIDHAGLIIGLLLIAAAGLLWWDAAALTLAWGYDPGPRAAPVALAAGLAVLATANILIAVRYEPAERPQIDMRAVLTIIGGLAGMIALIAFKSGFIPAMAFLFAATAAGFGRKAFFADLAIGAAAATVCYLLFAKVLTLSLPVGPLENLLQALGP